MAEKLNMYTVYILESINSGKLYTGYSDDIENRIKKHNSGGVRSTKTYKPYMIVYTEDFVDKTGARKRELFLKSGQGRKWIKENIDKWKGVRVVEGASLEN